MIKTRLVLPVLAAAAAIALLAGCGDGDSSSSTDPASVAPADAPVFIEAKIQPTGELKTNLEDLASNLAGVEDLGGTIVSYLEQSASDSDEPIDFEKDIQPWLGESAGIFLTEFDGDDFEGTGFAVAVTDTGEAQDFLDKQVESEDSESEDASYEGVDYKLDTEDEEAVGIVGGFIVFGDDEASFKAAVDASDGDSLAEADAYTSITPSSPQSSLADIYVNIGGLIEAAKSEVDPSALKFFEAAGVQVEKSSALVSLVPGSNNIEIDVASKLTDEVESAVPSTDAAQILGSMPANSIAALSAGDLGASIGELVDTIDEEGIPGEVPAGKFKSTLKEAGIDLEKITDGLGDAAVFAQGRSLLTLSGALVIEAKDPTEAQNTVSNIGTLLRANGTPGVTAVSGKASGFSVRSEDLGRQPLIVAAKGERIAIGYGLRSTLAGLDSESGATLSETKAYNEALNALGSTPITGFAAGAPALRLVEGLLTDPEDKEELEELTPYLSKVPFLAIGSETKEDVARARLILGVTE
jgi:Protein of unknown function (DUF3352)